MILDSIGIGRNSISEGAIDPEIESINFDTVEECTGDPFEYAVGIMYENEMAMQNIDMAVMCCEYAYLKENGTEMVYEAGVLKNFLESAKKKVKEWWAKIVAFFKKIFNYVANFVRTDEQFVKKYESAAKKAGTVKGLKLKGYDYKMSVPAEMMEAITADLDKASKTSKDLIGYLYDDDNTVDKELDKIRGDICQKGYTGAPKEISATEFSKELNKALKGGKEEKEDIVVWDCVKAIDEIKNAKKTKENLKKLFDKAKALANKATGELSEIENEARKEEKADPDNKEKQATTKGAHYMVTEVNSILSIATMVNNQGAKMITAANRQNRAFTAKALSKADKDKELNKAIKEGAYEDVFSAFGV